MVKIGQDIVIQETPRTYVERAPRTPPMDALEKEDIVFAIDTWIRAYRKASLAHPDGQTARTMRRMQALKEKYS
jgi:hypothetical protein